MASGRLHTRIVAVLLVVSLVLERCQAFLLVVPPGGRGCCCSSFGSAIVKHASKGRDNRRGRCAALSMSLAVGEELPFIMDTLTVTRVGVESEGEGSEEGPICRYRVKASIHGPDVKKLYRGAIKVAQERANYPGFRKGTVPPKYMGAVKQNAIHGAVLDACRHAVELHGMKNFEVKQRTIKMIAPNSIDALTDAYDMGADLEFEADIDAMGVPQPPQTTTEEEAEAAPAS